MEQRPQGANGIGIAGFVVSLVGLVLSCIGGALLSPVGLVLSLVGLRHERRGLAIAGTVLGGLGCLVLVLYILAFPAALVRAREMARVIKISANVRSFYASEGRLPKDLDELEGKYPLGVPMSEVSVRYATESETSCTLTMPGMDRTFGTRDDHVMRVDMRK